MKFSIDNLKKYVNSNLNIDYSIDFSNKIIGETDILSISKAQVVGLAYYDEEYKEYIFEVNLDVTLIMQCALTLDDVEYRINLDRDYIFKENTESSDDIYQIEGLTINLDEIIWSDILVEKPMKIIKDGANIDNLLLANNTNQTENKKSNNPFVDLKNFFDNKK